MKQPVLQSSSSLTQTIHAPLSGVVVPLEQVPDAVFAEKMVGDGVAIDPTSELLKAPCDGTITRVYQTAHAITLTTAAGLEIFMHIGLDTVILKGEGFELLVEEEQQVKKGAPLIQFDADLLAQRARSLLTMILLSQPEQIERMELSCGELVTAGAPLLQARLHPAEHGFRQTAQYKTLCSDWVPLLNPSGLHARPSAIFTNLVQQYQSEIYLRTATKSANARSVVALMGLNTRPGDLVQVEASGSDAQEAINGLLQSIQTGLGETLPSQSERVIQEPPLLANVSSDPNTLLGVSASPGSMLGQVVQLADISFEFSEFASDPAQEHRELKQALSTVRHLLEHMIANKISENKPEQADIFQLHQQLLSDPELKSRTRALINQGKSAAFAFSRAIGEQAGALSQLNNPFLACRASDLRDLRQRVLSQLLGQEEERTELPQNSIIIASDLTPSMAVDLDPSRVVGLATTGGGVSSHGAILARSMGIPAVVAIDDRAQQLANGTQVILDATAGHMRINLSHEQISELESLQARRNRQQQKDIKAASQPATTKDGHTIETMANIASQSEAIRSLSLGSEGIGLLRTELLFLERISAPTEEEQLVLYLEIIQSQQGRPVVFRTLDVGGDKPLPYINQTREANPFLGERGIRLCLNHPELLRTQVRAILRAGRQEQCRIRMMFPMVATLEEFRAAKGLVEQEAENIGFSDYELGLMVEVPATALMSHQFAEEVDFLSIGSNDLTQYTLAMDRSQPALAARMDSLNPAILRLIQLTVEGAQAHNKWVGLCGDLASDPQGIPILVGMGLNELSMAVPSLPAVKRQIRGLSQAQCQKIAQKAVACKTAKEVRTLIDEL